MIAAPLDRLPHFNPDLDIDPAPDSVAQWRREVASAHAVIICSPEYAFSIPGTLENALGWLVSSGDLYAKPPGVDHRLSEPGRGPPELRPTSSRR